MHAIRRVVNALSARNRDEAPEPADDPGGAGYESPARRGSPSSARELDGLYERACALKQRGELDGAADLFYRIAQRDARYRDAARLLVETTRPLPPARPCREPQLPADGIPRRLDRYELLEVIGFGTMGHVFLGLDPKIHRLLAIKVINLRAGHEPAELEEAAERFRREAESAGRISHPDIMTVHDAGESGGLAFIAMEYIKGRRLSDFTAPGHLLPARLVLELLARAARALDRAHELNVIHRDIKPANIMYDSVSDGLKITDFGIARLLDVSRTRTDIVLGTPLYMAPEQVEGQNVNRHTDLFALGVSLYQLLTGRFPFHGNSMTQLMSAIANEPQEPVTSIRPDLPASIDTILARALAKDPRERFAGGAELAAALRTAAARIG